MDSRNHNQSWILMQLRMDIFSYFLNHRKNFENNYFEIDDYNADDEDNAKRS